MTTDTVSQVRRSEIMSHIRSQGMVPELVVRHLVHHLGYRYRLHRKGLPGKPDLVFPGRSKVIFVHGCFWHQHDSPACKITRKPRSNVEYWHPKLERNRLRDADHIAALKRLGWETLTVWECETEGDQIELAQRVKDFLGP